MEKTILEERLYERAEKRLKNDIAKAMSKMKFLFSPCTEVSINEKTMPLGEIFLCIEKGIFKSYIRDYEKVEIDNLLSRMDNA